MTSMRRAFLAGTTIAAILLSPVMPGGSPRHVEPPTGQPVQTAAFRWPLDPPVAIVRGFAPPPEPWLPGHRGVDLAARPGQTVRAAGSGVVTFAGPIAGRGVLVIRLTATPTGPAADGPADTAGLRITYEPVHPRVHRGDRVRAGQVVGQMEGSHHCGVLGSCLHWGLRRGDAYLDPLLLVRPPRIRLLPLDRDPSPGSWPGWKAWSTSAMETKISRCPGLAVDRTRASRSRPGSCTAAPTGAAARHRSTGKSTSPLGARPRSVA